jgi:hypothetical protein
MYSKPYIKGFTTDPTLMRKAGVSDYESFAREILQEATPDRPISFEVFADGLPRLRGKRAKSRPGEQPSGSRSRLPIRVEKALCHCARG